MLRARLFDFAGQDSSEKSGYKLLCGSVLRNCRVRQGFVGQSVSIGAVLYHKCFEFLHFSNVFVGERREDTSRSSLANGNFSFHYCFRVGRLTQSNVNLEEALKVVTAGASRQCGFHHLDAPFW
jgi:hypothetical protein